jgi:hypothetical protein
VPTSTLHSDFGPNEADLSVKLGYTVAPSSQYPGHIAIFAHYCMNECSSNAFALMHLSHHDHRDVAIGHAIGKGTQKADNFTCLKCNERPRGSRQQFAKLFGTGNAIIPPSVSEKTPCSLNLGVSNPTG